MRKVTKHVYETSDGKPFDIKADAEKHEAKLSLVKFFEDFGNDPSEEVTTTTAAAIIDNLDRFAEIIRPLIRKPRAAKATPEEYEALLAEPRKGKAA